MKTILFFSVVMAVLIVRRADTIQWLDWLLGVGVGVMLSAWVAYWRLHHD
nr:MAG TPA: Membrane bound YbgT-like protein [Caudoviricetes sp.]